MLYLAEKWEGVMFVVLHYLCPRFDSSFDIPRVLLACEDFSGELPRLPLNSVHHVWLELAHVHLRYNIAEVNEWFLKVQISFPSSFLIAVARITTALQT